MKRFVLISGLLVLVVAGVWWLQRGVGAPGSARPVEKAPANAKATARSAKSSPPERTAGTLRAVAPPPSLPPVTVPPPAAPRALEQLPGKPSMSDVVQPGNRIFDAAIGLMAEYPTDWAVRSVALRWGENQGENTIVFRPPEGSRAAPSLYYRRYPDGPSFDMSNPEATLRDMARQKEISRIADGRADYRNDPDSFVFRTVNGNPSLSYFAIHTQPSTGEVRAEYFLRILGPTGYVMFFTNGPAKDVQALIPATFQMAGTVKPP